MNHKDITWAPVIPLIGGFPLGAEKSIGRAPEFIASYSGFEANDSHYVNYQNNVLGRDIDYHIISDDNKDLDGKSVNITVCTPPCAALSQLNGGKSAEVKGSGCAKNEWMYIAVQDSITRLNADVIIIENAPALYTATGEGVRNNLIDIAKEHNYGITLYKTSTHFHGIPQKRDRCFAMFFKGGKAPVLEFIDKPRMNYTEYLASMVHEDTSPIINPKLNDDPFLKFIRHKFPDEDPRDLIMNNRYTILKTLQGLDILEEANEWFHRVGDEHGIKKSEHALKKFSAGLNVWDTSVNAYNQVIHAVIGKNMKCTIHPTKDRSLTVKEAMWLMGIPEDFVLLDGLKKLNHIAQNVPVCTAADMVTQATKFLTGEIKPSHSQVVMQNNWKDRIDYMEEDKNCLSAYLQ